MADITVEQLAKMVGIPPEQLLLRLKNAGIEVQNSGQLITDEQKHLLLGYLKSTHTGVQESVAPVTFTLKRKKTSEAAAPARNIISVTVRKHRAYDVDKELAEEKRRIEEEEKRLLEKKLVAERKAQEEQERKVQAELLAHKKATGKGQSQQEAQVVVSKPLAPVAVEPTKPHRVEAVVVKPKHHIHTEVKQAPKKVVKAIGSRYKEKEEISTEKPIVSAIVREISIPETLTVA